MQGEALAFLFVYFGVRGRGRGGHTEKKTEKEKRHICYILVYKFNENRDVCITKQNIYFR